MRVRAGVLAVIVAAATVARGAAAQGTSDDENRAAARSAAIAGASAMNEGRYQEAADLFTRAESLVHAPTHLLYLARTQVKLGRLVKARENYLKIVREELAPKAPKPFVDAKAAAEIEIAEIEPRIATAKVVVRGEGHDDAAVTMDGQPLAPALVGVPFPIDPGKHEFSARTKRFASETVSATFTEGSKDPLDVALDLTIALPPEPIAEPAAPPPPAAAEPTRGPGPLPYIALGVGIAGLTVGTVFMLQNRSKRSDADALCPDGICPQSQRAEIEERDNQADSAATLSWIGYGVGIAGIATGAVLLLLAPKKTPVKPAVSGRFVGIGGSF